MLGINTVFLTLFTQRNCVCDFIIEADGLYGIQVKCSNDNVCWQVCGRDGSAAILVAKKSAGVAQEVNLRERISCIPPPSVNKADYSR